MLLLMLFVELSELVIVVLLGEVRASTALGWRVASRETVREEERRRRISTGGGVEARRMWRWSFVVAAVGVVGAKQRAKTVARG